MRLYDFANGIVTKFSPISPTEASDLQSQAVKTYATIKKEAEENQFHNAVEAEKKAKDPSYVMQLKTLSMKERVIMFFESWWMRYLVAFIFVFAVRKIQRYLTETDDLPEESPISEYEEFLEFKRSLNHKR